MKQKLKNDDKIYAVPKNVPDVLLVMDFIAIVLVLILTLYP